MQSMYWSTIPESKGPGRYIANAATKSSKQSAFNFLIIERIPSDSSWNTPIVSASLNSLNVSASSISSLTLFMSGTAFPLPLMFSRASSIIESVERPRKSIFTRPSSSTSPIVNCVTTCPVSPSPSLLTGTASVTGIGVITTPAACCEVCRANPSMFPALSIMLRLTGSASYSALRSGVSSSA